MHISFILFYSHALPPRTPLLARLSLIKILPIQLCNIDKWTITTQLNHTVQGLLIKSNVHETS